MSAGSRELYSTRTGLPLAGTTVTLRGAGDDVTQTDAKGEFAFQGLRSGEYKLTATLPGFAAATRTIRLAAGELSRLSFTLEVQFLEQTFVTASRTGETDVQATPLAISVLTGAQLARMQDDDVEQVASRAPSVTFSQNTGLAQLTIRGIGTNAVFAGSDPSSAVYLDGVYLARPAMVLADFLELERVEVLRGPQGTLYGRNSLGGAINLLTKPPTADVEASVRVGGGTQGTFRTEARVSGPIVPGRLMASGAILRAVRSGFVHDLTHPDHPLGGEDVIAARGQLRLLFDQRSELHVSADVTHSDAAPLYYSKILAVKPGFTVDNPTGFHDVRASFPAVIRQLQSGVSARFKLDVTPSLHVVSLTAYRQVDLDAQIDGDISELDLNVTRVHEIQHQVSEEVTVSHLTSRLTWIGGIFLFDEADYQPSSFFSSTARLESRLDPHVDANARALFGQATVRLTPRVGVTAGLRYTNERKEIVNAANVYSMDDPAVLVSPSYAYVDAITHDAWTPKFGVDLRVRNNILAYGAATRGFKSGGFNLTSPETGRGFAPEWAWSYEGGLKTTFARQRAMLNVAAFHTNYTNLQVQTGIRPGVVDISNAAAATIRGLEIEGATRLGGAVQTGGHLAWLDATYDRYLAVGPSGITGDVTGHRLNNAPEWSGRVWIDWTRPTGRGNEFSLRADSTWKTTAHYSPFNDSVQQQGPFGLLDISAQYGPPRHRWSVSVYARNLTDTEYITGAVGTPPTAFGGRPGESRRLGVQLALER